jgi:hypothetical protein
MLVDVVLFICRGQNFRFIDVINANALKDLSPKFNVYTDPKLRGANLRFYKMPNTDFSHHRYSHSFDYFLNHLGITLRSYKIQYTYRAIFVYSYHSCDSPFFPDVSRHSFECHNSTCSRFLGYPCLKGIRVNHGGKSRNSHLRKMYLLGIDHIHDNTSLI